MIQFDYNKKYNSYTAKKELFDKFRDNNILVIGDMMLDEYIKVHSTSIKEQLLKTSINADDIIYCLGGAANVMANLVNLGSNPYLCTVHGRASYSHIDAIGKQFKKLNVNGDYQKITRNYQIQSGRCRYRMLNSRFGLFDNILINDHPKYKAVIKTRYINMDTDVLEYRVDTENDPDFKFDDDYLHSISVTDLKYFFDKFYKYQKGVIFSDYNKGFVKKALLIQIKDELSDCFIAVDPHPNNDFDLIRYLDKIDLLKVNKSELEKFISYDNELLSKLGRFNLKYNYIKSEENLNLFKSILKKFIDNTNKNIHYCIVTLDNDGIICFNNKTDEIFFSHSFYIKDRIKNTNGAGDSVIALLTNIAMIEPLTEEHLDIANLGANTVINKKVTVPLNKEYILSS